MKATDRLKIAVARRKLASRKISEDSENPLEEWIVNEVKKAFNRSPELKSAIGTNRLDEVDRTALREYQLFRFREQMRYTEANSIFYKDRFKNAGVAPEDIRELSDLQKVPFTLPSDLAKEPFHFLCVSQTKAARAFSTTGTSGIRKRIFYTNQDILHIVDAISSALRMLGMKDGETLQVMFPCVSAWDPGLMMESACVVAGFKATLCDSIDVDEQIQAINGATTSAMIGLTSFIHRITVLARDRYDLRSLGIRTIICAAEPLPEAMRVEMEEAWGAKVHGMYGLTEMGLADAIECTAGDGLHVDDADLLIECVDPETGEQLGDREEGELVFTSLNMQGTPLLRYRSRDLSSVIEPPCGCGAGVMGKIGKIQGRLDMMTKMGFGRKVYPLLFDEVILKVPDVVSYQAILGSDGYRDTISFKVESKDTSSAVRRAVEDAILSLDEIRDGLEQDLLVSPSVEMVEAGSVMYAPKVQAIIDNRRLYD